MGFSHFRHPFDNLPYQVTHTDGSTSERNKENMPFNPFDMPAAHIFKIGADGLVHEIEAVGLRRAVQLADGLGIAPRASRRSLRRRRRRTRCPSRSSA